MSRAALLLVSPATRPLLALGAYVAIAVAAFALVRYRAVAHYRAPTDDADTAYRLRTLRHRAYLYGWLATVAVTVTLDVGAATARLVARLPVVRPDVATVLASVLVFTLPAVPVVVAVQLAALPYRRLVRSLDLRPADIAGWLLSRSVGGLALTLVAVAVVASTPAGWPRLLVTIALVLLTVAAAPLALSWGTRDRPPTPVELAAAEPALAGTGVRLRVTDDRTRVGSALAAGVLPRGRYVFVAASLFETLADDELAAVVAHEVGHHERGHVLIQSLAFAAPFLVWLALLDFRVPGGVLLGGVLTALSLVAVGALVRWTERDADAYAAERIGGDALARALRHLLERRYIMTQTGLFGGLVAVHPPVSARIRRLSGESARSEATPS